MVRIERRQRSASRPPGPKRSEFEGRLTCCACLMYMPKLTSVGITFAAALCSASTPPQKDHSTEPRLTLVSPPSLHISGWCGLEGGEGGGGAWWPGGGPSSFDLLPRNLGLQ